MINAHESARGMLADQFGCRTVKGTFVGTADASLVAAALAACPNMTVYTVTGVEAPLPSPVEIALREFIALGRCVVVCKPFAASVSYTPSAVDFTLLNVDAIPEEALEKVVLDYASRVKESGVIGFVGEAADKACSIGPGNFHGSSGLSWTVRS